MIHTRILYAVAALLLLAPTLAMAQGKWVKISAPSTDNYKGVCAASEARWYAVGDGGLVRKSVDSGKTWTTVAVPTTNGLWGVYATPGASGDIVYVAGDAGTLLKSTNGGGTWTPQEIGYHDGFTFGIHGYDANNCWVTGGEGSGGPTTGVIVTTHDGGATWTKVSIPGTYSFDKCWFVSPMIGYAAGSADASFGGGVIYKTTNGGTTWSKVKTTTGGANCIACPDSQTCFAVGFNGVAVKSTDAGANWSNLTLPAANTTSIFTHVSFLDGANGFMAGPLSVMLKTVDGGTTWARDVSFTQTSPTIWTMATAGGQLIVAVGDAGAMYRLRAKKALPTATIDVDPLNFDSVTVGQSAERLRELRAANSAGLRVDSVYIESGDGFSIGGTVGPFPVTLALGDAMPLVVRFNATAINKPDSATLVIQTNDAQAADIRIPLLAFSSLSPRAAYAKDLMDFDTVAVGASVQRSLVVRAGNAAGLLLESLRLEGAGAGSFSVVAPIGGFPRAIATPGDSVVVTVRFAPSVPNVGSQARLVVVTNDPAEREGEVALAGFAAPRGAGVAGSAGEHRIEASIHPQPLCADGYVDVRTSGRGHLAVELCDMRGAVMAVLCDRVVEGGHIRLPVQAGALAAGTYYCVVRSNGQTAVREIVVVK